jgi:ubiquinone/menaquinone biosynthesis C-methylase UbiE
MQLACYVCGSSEGRPWGSENGYQAVRCRDCGLVYVSPRPALESISRAAQTGLHAGEHELAVTGDYAKKKVALYARRLAELYGPGYFHGAGERWLDVGAGFGEFLEALAHASGGTLRARGLEPNETKAASARGRGLTVTFVELSELGERFHFISLLNVLSHLPDPPAMLTRLRELLEPGGELLLQTGNFAELERAEIPVSLDLPDHLSFANERLLVRVLERAGFAVVGSRSYPMFASQERRRFGIKRAPSAPERQCLDLWLRARVR